MRRDQADDCESLRVEASNEGVLIVFNLRGGMYPACIGFDPDIATRLGKELIAAAREAQSMRKVRVIK